MLKSTNNREVFALEKLSCSQKGRPLHIVEQKLGGWDIPLVFRWNRCCVLSTAPFKSKKHFLAESYLYRYQDEVDRSEMGHGFEGHLSL